jgi:hypothetical protein
MTEEVGATSLHLMERMGPGSAPLRGLAGMTVEGNYYAAANADMS